MRYTDHMEKSQAHCKLSAQIAYHQMDIFRQEKNVTILNRFRINKNKTKQKKNGKIAAQNVLSIDLGLWNCIVSQRFNDKIEIEREGMRDKHNTRH